ncbi:hypothetical protein EYV94_20170 [Puteibacter caeruleilacunae]|nr:hypothetical protein EYV94_20170 [Puteibacter caeruleilacunae]
MKYIITIVIALFYMSVDAKDKYYPDIKGRTQVVSQRKLNVDLSNVGTRQLKIMNNGLKEL